jgi:hypothetical protein
MGQMFLYRRSNARAHARDLAFRENLFHLSPKGRMLININALRRTHQPAAINANRTRLRWRPTRVVEEDKGRIVAESFSAGANVPDRAAAGDAMRARNVGR